MTLIRVWLQEREGKRYIKDYRYEYGSFGVNLTADPEAAVTVVTDVDQGPQVMLRLFQALTRHPAQGSHPLSFHDALSAYELIRETYTIAGRNALPEEEALPNSTQVVGESHYDIDAFGAERQIEETANRIVDFNGDYALRHFHMLDIGLFVDAETGRFYPGITVAGQPDNLFWALPDELAEWAVGVRERNLCPCDVTFAVDEDDQLHVSFANTPQQEEES